MPMVVTSSTSIPAVQSPALSVPDRNKTSNSAQPFSNQLGTAISENSSGGPAEASGSPPASSSPAILSVTILPWGRSIAYASQAAASTSLPSAQPVVPAPTATTVPATSISPPAAPLPPSQQAINALSDILSGYGINPASLGLSYSEKLVAGPAGTYTNRMITANFPSGKSQDYSAELTLKNPTVAAVEIMGMLGRRIVA
jgi:hypothetical protein